MSAKKPYDDVEYVDAEPIDGTGAAAPAPAGPRQGQPQVYSYYHKSESCVPCCGPFGCSLLLLLFLGLWGNRHLLDAALYAVAILVVVSVLTRLLARRQQ